MSISKIIQNVGFAEEEVEQKKKKGQNSSKNLGFFSPSLGNEYIIVNTVVNLCRLVYSFNWSFSRDS